ncbi:U6 snRNA phosphodiesterase Usb1 [Crucibulum laeve]|uniref:U6 snRNA phosphodiesterase n=1 Tax=Crucibulum laeve TaxID=68775 RepID=A0A5C3MA76_9AGAR|nr:U6 snRNA phosphodiesterase Usb1 [Crucibulum laeve]
MKRCSNLLVTYDSSDDSDSPSFEEREQPPPVKKRKLPSLSSSIVIPGPIDNPSLHQGRIRTTPHVEGQFAAHVYVSLLIRRRSTLYKLMQDAILEAKKIVPTLRELWSRDDNKEPSSPIELHISLSRPVYLRAHQREDFRKAVKALSKGHKPFTVSFATFSELVNDEKTRTFLTIEVGAGYHELTSLSKGLTPALHAIRQKEFYTTPRFHASIAWALLDRLHSGNAPVRDQEDHTPHGTTTSTPEAHSAIALEDFPTIPYLPKMLVSKLNAVFSGDLASPTVGSFDIDQITVKIGKEVSSWSLAGI